MKLRLRYSKEHRGVRTVVYVVFMLIVVYLALVNLIAIWKGAW